MPLWMCETTESILADLRLRMNGKDEHMRNITIGSPKRRQNRFGGVKFNRARRQRP